jgi:hypothetical protein
VNGTVQQLKLEVWRVVAGGDRIIRHRREIKTFAPWDVTAEDDRRLWAAFNLDSAVGWIRTGTTLACKSSAVIYGLQP